MGVVGRAGISLIDTIDLGLACDMRDGHAGTVNDPSGSPRVCWGDLNGLGPDLKRASATIFVKDWEIL